MSDTAQGPGWWMSTDGKFYPPATPPPEPNKKNDSGCAKMLLAVVLVLGGFAAFVAILNTGGSKVVSNATPSTAAGQGTAPPTTAAATWELTPISQQAVIDQLRTRSLSPSNVSVDGTVIIVQYKPSLWDENTSVQKAGELGLDTSQALFSNPAVTSVTTGVLADFTDTYGKTETEVALSSTIDRATADKITWDGLRNRVKVDGSDWFCLAVDKKVHPAILRAVESNRGLLPGSC